MAGNYDLTQAGPEVQEILDKASALPTAQQLQTTLSGMDTRISTNEEDIAQLQAAYAALTQSEPVIVEPTEQWPVANPQTNTIYRVIDRENTPPEYYSDYMYNGTALVLMATYNNAIDSKPTAGSPNLVTSGGVFNALAEKPNVDGFYDGMTVGTARNLLGKATVTETFWKKTLGSSIAKGLGYVDKVQGESVAWSQLVPDPTEKMTSSYFGSIHNGTFNCDVSHKYYIIIYAKTSDTEYPQARVLIGTPSAFNSPTFVMEGISATYQRFTKILAPYNTANGCQLKLASAYGANLYSKDCQVIDLTALGIDSLTTAEEVEAWLATHVGKADYYAYDAGSLLSVKMASLKSTGATIGTNTRNLDVTNITGINPTTGTREKCFPNGMYSSGTTHDEIVVENGALIAKVAVEVTGTTPSALATPIVYTDLQDGDGNPIVMPLGIPVEPLGTLEVLPENTEGEALTMCAPTLTLRMSIDAVHLLTDEVPDKYQTYAIDKQNMNALVAAINQHLGATMGGTFSVVENADKSLSITFQATINNQNE